VGAGGEQRGKWGGGGRLGAAGRKGNGRERGAQARHGSADRVVGMVLGDAVRGGSACSWWRWASEQGRAAGHKRHGAVRLTGRAGQQRGPVSAVGCGRERGKQGSMAVGHRHAGPATQCQGAVQTRF
jgi:hypothetical protein